MKSDSELQKLRYDNKELREAADRLADRIKALEQIKDIQRKLLADAKAALALAFNWLDPDNVPEADYEIIRAALAPEQDK